MKKLSEVPDKKETIFLGDISKEFRQDLQQFIFGETLTIKDGRAVIGKNLYKNWLLKIKTKGFDYDIKFL
ncbi:hypothetical protein [uncultured Pedobacter sp.]|uniref:hypothetical protein n=1 Tax=uncultured Pedobacter sp. TaxID=246139 RepID=UPI0026002CF1|nr:hypothetical protein [uncultured Pedobacter sp.]